MCVVCNVCAVCGCGACAVKNRRQWRRVRAVRARSAHHLGRIGVENDVVAGAHRVLRRTEHGGARLVGLDRAGGALAAGQCGVALATVIGRRHSFDLSVMILFIFIFKK